MANLYRGTTQIGVTAYLLHRIMQHRDDKGAEHCRKYGLKQLVYMERHDDIRGAIKREKAMKK